MRRLLLLALVVLTGCTVQLPGGTPVPVSHAKPTPTQTATVPAPTQTAGPETRTVSVDILHVRSCAGVECPVVGYLYRGQSVYAWDREITPEGSVWICITPGCDKWVNRSCTRYR